MAKEPDQKPQGGEKKLAAEQQRLSESDSQKILAWLKDKTKTPKCPVCHSQRWTVGPHLLHGQIYNPAGAFIIGGSSYPQAVVVCDNCFYVRTFMAVPLGLDATSDPEDEGGEGA